VPTGGTRLVDSQDELTNKPSTKKRSIDVDVFCVTGDHVKSCFDASFETKTASVDHTCLPLQLTPTRTVAIINELLLNFSNHD